MLDRITGIVNVTDASGKNPMGFLSTSQYGGVYTSTTETSLYLEVQIDTSSLPANLVDQVGVLGYTLPIETEIPCRIVLRQLPIRIWPQSMMEHLVILRVSLDRVVIRMPI